MRKPSLHLDVDRITADFGDAFRRFWSWLQSHNVRVLNVAGSRVSKALGIEDAVAQFLGEVLRPGRAPEEYAGDAERPFSGPPVSLAAEDSVDIGAHAKPRRKRKPTLSRPPRARGKGRPKGER